MRPGPAGVPGTGGLFSRQPRVTLLVVLTVAALGGWVGVRLRAPAHAPRARAHAARSRSAVGDPRARASSPGSSGPAASSTTGRTQPKIANTPATRPTSVPSTPSTGTGSTTAKPRYDADDRRTSADHADHQGRVTPRRDSGGVHGGAAVPAGRVPVERARRARRRPVGARRGADRVGQDARRRVRDRARARRRARRPSTRRR